MYTGYIDYVRDGEVVGWLAGVNPHAVPAILVDGVPAQNLETHLPREDVQRQLGLATGCGFRARIMQRVHGTVEVEMWAASAGDIVPVCARTIDVHANAAGPGALVRAAEIARRQGSIAVAVWEGSHNPVGRAKVLYDIVAPHRPTVLFAFTFGTFGTTLWPPIANASIDVVLIPYAERFAYADVLREQRIAFDTVWICKDRLPSFELAEMIAHEKTRFILDLDDDEENFARSTKRTSEAYGALGINKAAFMRGRVGSRTVASRALQQRFGGRIVRHVRAPRQRAEGNGATGNGAAVPPTANGGAHNKNGVNGGSRPFRFIFMGTVRPHKNLEAAARALALFRFRHGLDVSLAVGGVFDPPTLKGTLAGAGATIVDAVEADALQDTIAQYDAVLAGYPDTADSSARIADWQISSKVGDALAAGRPVLVPAGPSTADLADVPGVILFDEAGFDAAVRIALEETRSIALPADFTAEHAFRVFLEAEADAVGALAPARRTWAVRGEPAARTSLLLLWKQNDAGLFGRRVDQIARLYAHMHPEHDVHVLEIDPFVAKRPAARTEMTSLDALAGKLAASKELARREGTIVYRSLSYGDGTAEVALSRRMLAYLQANRLTPADTVAVVFPFNRRFNAILNLLEPYAVIADIVDHQLMWGSFERRPLAVQQYFALSRLARFEVFNSEANREAFAAANLVNPAASPHVIPNWYMLPPEVDLPPQEWRQRQGVFYSGNFNDRIDWALLAKVADLVGTRGEPLHLVGSGEQAADRLCHLLGAHPQAVFHGPMHETETLWLGASSRAAIVPHQLDQHSAHMDPIKVRMYQLIGLPCVSTAVPGPRDDGTSTFVAHDHDAFLAMLERLVDRTDGPVGGNICNELSADGLRYIDLIARARRDRRAAAQR